MRLPTIVLTLIATLLLSEFAIAGKPGSTTPTKPAPSIMYSLSYLGLDGLIRCTNEYGVSVGASSAGAIVVYPDGTKQVLNETVDPLLWDLRTAMSINASNQIAGRAMYYKEGVGWVNAVYRLTPATDTQPQIIEPILGAVEGTSVIVYDMNEYGDVILTRVTATGALGDRDIIVFSGAPGAGTCSFVLSGPYNTITCINNTNQIGGTNVATGKSFRYDLSSGQMETFSPLLVLKSGGLSLSREINDLGVWVGEATAVKSGSNLYAHAVVCVGTTLKDLGVLPNRLQSQAASINNSGVVVGTSGDSTNAQGFVYLNGYMYSLPEVIQGGIPAGVTFLNPRHVGESGTISGEATYSGIDALGGFVLTPIQP